MITALCHKTILKSETTEINRKTRLFMFYYISCLGTISCNVLELGMSIDSAIYNIDNFFQHSYFIQIVYSYYAVYLISEIKFLLD